MLRFDDVRRVSDDATRELCRLRPAHAARIAFSCAELKRRIAERCFPGGAPIEDPARVLALCEAASDCLPRVPPDVLREIEDSRLAALRSLIGVFYDARKRAAPDRADALDDEMRLAALAALALKEVRRLRPPRWSPRWLAEHCPDLHDGIEEEVYDLAADAEDWRRFAVLLPEEPRARFDAADVRDVFPSVIANEEEAHAIVRRLAERDGVDVRVFLQPSRFAENLRRHPAFKKVMEFFAYRPKPS